jgi:predicted GNAT superfamily acetyltransferase
VEVLGARAASFHLDFYGAMTDQINAGDVSDRLEAVWTLTEPLPGRDARAARAAATDDRLVPLLVERDGWPHPTGVEPRAGALLPVPADYERLRREQPDLARAWRTACREILRTAYGNGLQVTQVTGTGYALHHPEEL